MQLPCAKEVMLPSVTRSTPCRSRPLSHCQAPAVGRLRGSWSFRRSREDPLSSVVIGAGKALEELEILRQVCPRDAPYNLAMARADCSLPARPAGSRSVAGDI